MYENRNIYYIPETNPENDRIKHLLDIFYPHNKQELSPMIIFVHGGTWMNGSKEIYSTFGKNLAAKGIVSVILNYRLGDIVNFKKMASDCASAVKWAYRNGHEFGGNKNKIFMCGHSAGGHLSALIALGHEYFDQLNMDNPIKGCILIDAFGLNIGTFIKDHGALYLQYIEKVFTKDPEIWKQASPIEFISQRKIPFMILIGSKTYPILTTDNEIFFEKLKKSNPDVSLEIVDGKTHVEMISQFDNKNILLYDKLISFVMPRLK
ncbi:MAG: alpha/beta hydrolase [Bacteroidota bacterium]|nr:alpha/beta hydrolase [Bacteroidota bacterium]